MRKIITNILFVFGIIVCLAPIILNVFDRNEQKGIIGSYKSEISNMDNKEIEEELKKANEYNEYQYEMQQGNKIGEEPKYEDMLATKDFMCTISIPKINVELPVYHDTNTDVLAKALGHLKGTSLPVGGKNTHSFITGHRGLPSSKLFVRLDEMEKDDMFYIQVYDKTLAYKVVNIQVVEPDDTKVMKIEPDRDLVSLVTCTPYGINTHRLIVTGERTEYKATKTKINPISKPSARELLNCVPLILVALFIVDSLNERRKNK